MKKYTAIGLMSGTSLDGLDICHAEFRKEDSWKFKILNAETRPYPTQWEDALRNAPNLGAEDLLALHSAYGFYLAESVSDFIKIYGSTPDLVASHGHTVFHQPERKFTLQIGDGRAIRIRTGIPTVYDFRSADVLLGGNGAPLVPIGDELLFGQYEACINLSGFSNISFSAPGGRIAFDICPVNIALNHFAKKLGKAYDFNGEMAARGRAVEEILARLNELEYYRRPAPKSLGAEWFYQNFLPLLEQLAPADALATAARHAAEQISKILESHQIVSAMLSGGGAHDRFLIENIRGLSRAKIEIPDAETVNSKEALIFGFMGVLRMRNENNVLASATGASRDHSGGIIV